MNLLSVLRELQAVGGDNAFEWRSTIRSVQRRGRIGQTAIRHRASPGDHAQSRRAFRGFHFSVRGRRLRCGDEVDSADVHRPWHADRIRVGPLDLHRAQQKEEAWRADDRRPAFRRMISRRMTPADWPIIDELEKQYEVVRIDPASRSRKSSTRCWPCSRRRWGRRKWKTSSRRSAAGSRRPFSRTRRRDYRGRSIPGTDARGRRRAA